MRVATLNEQLYLSPSDVVCDRTMIVKESNSIWVVVDTMVTMQPQPNGHNHKPTDTQGWKHTTYRL